jgi:hypothetical protein
MIKISLTALVMCITLTALQAQDKKSSNEVSKNWMHAQAGLYSFFSLLKTKTGFLIYNNHVFDGYTIRIDSSLPVGGGHYQLLNGNYFIHSWLLDNRIKAKGDTPEQVLSKFMLDEWKYLTTHTRYGHKIRRINRFIPLVVDTLVQNIDSLNFWHYDIHNFKGETLNEIKTVFYMEGYFDNFIIRLIYHSKTGLVDEAEKDLLRLFKSIIFYSGQIDIGKLEDAIKLGKYSYEETFD